MIDKKICAIYQKNINCSLQTHTHQDDSLTVTKISLTLPWRSSRTDFPGEHRALFSAAAEHNSHKSQVPDILPVGGIIQHRSTHLFIYITDARFPCISSVTACYYVWQRVMSDVTHSLVTDNDWHQLTPHLGLPAFSMTQLIVSRYINKIVPC